MRRVLFLLVAVLTLVVPVSSPTTHAATLGVPPSQTAVQAVKTVTDSATLDPIAVRRSQSPLKGRNSLTAVRLLDGRYLLSGGVSDAYRNPEIYSEAEIMGADGRFTQVGDLNVARYRHSAMLLDDGRVLILGGVTNGSCTDNCPEIFDPATNIFTRVPNFTVPPYRVYRLDDGRGLVVNRTRVAVYDPATATRSITGTLALTRDGLTAVALADRTVLVVGGENSGAAEIYDPTSGTVTKAGTMTRSRRAPAAVLLDDGRVLIMGGDNSANTAEIYDPTSGTFTSAGTMTSDGSVKTVTKLADGNVLILGQTKAEYYDAARGVFVASAARRPDGNTDFAVFPLLNGDIKLINPGVPGNLRNDSYSVTYRPLNTVTATLQLPDNWINSTRFKIGVRVTSNRARVVNGEVLSGNGSVIGSQFALSPNVPISVTLDLGALAAQGTNNLSLRVYDEDGRSGIVVRGDVRLDTVVPSTGMRGLPPITNQPLNLVWYGSDATSGIKQYTVEVRKGLNGAWERLLNATEGTTYTFPGENGQGYYFRVRAIDNAGNVEAWPATYDTSTYVDTRGPRGIIDISFVGTGSVDVLTAASDAESGLQDMRVAFAQNFGSTQWTDYRERIALSRIGAPGGCLIVVAQFRDRAGNLSPLYRQPVPGTGCSAQQTQVFLPLVLR